MFQGVSRSVTLFCLLCLFIASCNPPSGSYNKNELKSVLRLATQDDPSSMDPRVGGDNSSQAILRLLFEGLMRLDSAGKPRPALTESLELSKCGTIYTFHLKETFWSNGDVVTAYDFEHAWKSIIAKDSPSWFGYAFYIIKDARRAKLGEISVDEVGIMVPDARTLIVHLEHPAPYFLELTANPIYAPVCKKNDLANPAWANSTGEHYVCNGPFTPKSYLHRRQLTLARNLHYWDHLKVSLDYVSVAIVPDGSTILRLFELGELDWVGGPLWGLPREAIPELRRSGKLRSEDASGLTWLEFNVDSAPFNHPYFRKAFSYAINREELATHILKGGEEPAFSILPKCMKLREKPLFSDHNLSIARELFNEALRLQGVTKEQLPPLVLSYPHKYKPIVQVLQQQWKEAFDVEVYLENSEWNVYIDRLTNHDFQMAILGWVSWFNDPIYNLENQKYRKNLMNDTGWENQGYITLLDKADQTLDPKERFFYLNSAEELLLEEMPLCPIYYSKEYSLVDDCVRGIYRTPLGNIDFTYAYKNCIEGD